jgi:L-lysine 6-transaminase
MKGEVELRPELVLGELERHVLVDGFRLVLDLEKSRGCHMVDAISGRELLDFYGFYGSLPVGFNHPYFAQPEVQADLLRGAIAKVANADVYTVPYAEFVRTFSRVAGLPPLERYFFIDGGALAVENALKAAMDWKVRRNLARGLGERGTAILHFERAFHGRSGYTLSLTNTDPRKTDYFAKFPWPRVPAPCLNFALARTARLAEVATQEQAAEARIRTILEQQGADIAAIIIEPIQGEGGDNHFRAEWFHALRRICDESDVLLIFDEVQCGLGITGRTWTCQHFGVRPDLLAFGKKTQVCGVMAGPRLEEVPENVFRLPGRINSTWGGNLADMVRATHYLRLIERDDLIGNARIQGERFLAGLQALATDYPVLTAVRGRGLMTAFDLPDRERRDWFHRGLFDLGLVAIRCGERSIRFRPVLDVPASAIDQALELLTRLCRQLPAGRDGSGRQAA